MKNYQEALGIDVSKKTLDVKCHLAGVHRVFNNDYRGYLGMCKWVGKVTHRKRFFIVLKIRGIIRRKDFSKGKSEARNYTQC
jgi:hypothetical protein